MTTKQIQYKLLLREYDKKRMHAMHLKKLHEEEIYQKIPDIYKIDQSLKRTGVHLVRHMLHTPGNDFVEDFKSRSQELLRTKKMLLVEGGYPSDYLDFHYTCHLCEDTGFVEDKPCKCFKQGLIDMAYTQSNLKNVLKSENFSTFSFNYYAKEKDKDYGISPYEHMQELHQMSVAFVERFDTEHSNLLFYGSTGLGKTFLCNCIAKELLDTGHNVLYLPAPALFKLFDEARFHREDMPDESKNILDTLLTVELLIIDDLGTEFGTSFTGPDLFEVLNTRLLNQKSTIISTNLQPNEWKSLYSERIVSRIFGNYTSFGVFGKDIRLMKKYAY